MVLTSTFIFDTEILALLLCFESVVVTQAPSVDELAAHFCFLVVVPLRIVAFAWSRYFRQLTSV